MQAIGQQSQRAPDDVPIYYERHRPENTTLYRLVQQPAASLIAHTEANTVAELPQFIMDELHHQRRHERPVGPVKPEQVVGEVWGSGPGESQPPPLPAAQVLAKFRRLRPSPQTSAGPSQVDPEGV